MKEEKIKSIEEFLGYYPNKNTKSPRKSGLLAFLEFICKNKRASDKVTDQEMEQFEKHLKKYMTQDRDHFDDLLRFAVSLNDRPPLTAKAYISSMKEYFARHGIEFTPHQLKDIRNKLQKGKTRTEEEDLTKDVIKKILAYSDVRGRALFLTLISTGMRIGECLQLNLSDIDIKNRIVHIRGQYTKNGDSRYSFLNEEALNAIVAYLHVRERYMETTFKRGGRVMERKKEYQNRMFPFSQVVALQIFSTALQKAGLEQFSSEVRRRTFHIHQFRKFFRSQLAIDCPVDIVESLMGHNGYLSDAYRRYTKEQMFEHYQKAENNLYINEVDIDKIESEYRRELEISKQDLKSENAELRRKVAEMEETMQKFNAFMQSMEELKASKYPPHIQKKRDELPSFKP